MIEFGDAEWRVMADALATRDDPDNLLFEASISIFILQGWGPRIHYSLYWGWVRDGRNGPAPMFAALPLPPDRNLQALARDPQNVHTRDVSNQTNASMDKLMATEIPRSQQTEKIMASAWVNHVSVGWTDILRTLNDVNKWFNTKTCRNNNDQLYRCLLRGLVATINNTDAEMRTELYKRLWEECRESVGMCCEGHITRLCNVMVGFDDAFKPPVPVGEILQQKMAAIAGLDVTTEMKHTHANAVFDELNIPAEQRVAWLEAF